MNSTFGKKITAVALAFLLALVPLDFNLIDNGNSVNLCRYGVEIQRNEAHAIAPAVAGAGIAVGTVAAELGISEAALAAGMAAIVVGGTGLYFMGQLNDTQYGHLWGGDLSGGYEQNWDTAYQKWKVGGANNSGSKSWEELSDEEKAQYDSPADYVYQQQLLLTLYFPDLFTPGGGDNGDMEPNEEPDPNTDPEGNQRWNTLRDGLTVMATGAAVGFQEQIGAFAEGLGENLHDLLFGTDPTSELNPYSLLLDYNFNADIGGIDVTFKTAKPNYNVTNGMGYKCYLTPAYWAGVYGGRYAGNANRVNGSTWRDIAGTTVVMTRNRTNTEYTGKLQNYVCVFSDSNLTPTMLGYSGTLTVSGPFNAYFNGTYVWQDADGNRLNSYNQGAFEAPVTKVAEYGQMENTPEGLANSINNYNEYNNWVNNYSNDVPEGQRKAIQIPDALTGTDGEPQYGDFVIEQPEGGTDPDPDPDPGTDPDNPGTDPDNPGTDDPNYNEDIGSEITELLARPFDELFPFCLIGDLRDVTQKVETAFTSGEASTKVSFPLEGFGVDGLDDLEIDLDYLQDLGEMVKPWVNVLFIVGLIIGTFSFFLKRGGE